MQKKCAHPECGTKPTRLMKWRRKGEVQNFYLCVDHATHHEKRLEPKNVHYVSGEACPFCFLGFVQQWAHRDRGVCYRCGGTGFFGHPRKFEGVA